MVAKRKIAASKQEATEVRGFNVADHTDLIIDGVRLIGKHEGTLQDELVACLNAGQPGRAAIEKAAAKLAEATRNKDSGKVQASSDDLKRLRANLHKASVRWNKERGQEKAKALTVVVKDREQNIWAVEDVRGITRTALKWHDEKVLEAFAADKTTKFAESVKADMKERGADEDAQETVLLEALVDLAILLDIEPAELADLVEQRKEAIAAQEEAQKEEKKAA